MIFLQSLYDNFLSHTHVILLFSLHCFWPMKREKKKVVTKIVSNGCSNITTIYIVYLVIFLVFVLKYTCKKDESFLRKKLRVWNNIEHIPLCFIPFYIFLFFFSNSNNGMIYYLFSFLHSIIYHHFKHILNFWIKLVRKKPLWLIKKIS